MAPELGSHRVTDIDHHVTDCHRSVTDCHSSVTDCHRSVTDINHRETPGGQKKSVAIIIRKDVLGLDHIQTNILRRRA